MEGLSALLLVSEGEGILKQHLFTLAHSAPRDLAETQVLIRWAGGQGRSETLPVCPAPR